MHPCRLMLANVFNIESLLLCAVLSPPASQSFQVCKTFLHFIIADIVYNFTTKLRSMVHGDRILNHRGISDSTSWNTMQGILTRTSLSSAKYKILYFTLDRTFRSKCSALYYELMLRIHVLLRNAFVVHP